MSIFRHLFGMQDAKEAAGLRMALDRAIDAVDPLLRQTGAYPDRYLISVAAALDYARRLAFGVPGPVEISNGSFAKNAYVHAILPSQDFVTEALCRSHAIQVYRQDYPENTEIYALMGMRRMHKSMLGMTLSGEVMQRDVPQNVVYFTSHTLDYPAATEDQCREDMTWQFFDTLVSQVAQRINARKHEKQDKLLDRDRLLAQLHLADATSRPDLAVRLKQTLSDLQIIGNSLSLDNYPADFETVLKHPLQYLHIDRVEMVLDGMGVEIHGEESDCLQPVVFNELVGFDQRNWTVTLVHCRDMPIETFSDNLANACRSLSI